MKKVIWLFGLFLSFVSLLAQEEDKYPFVTYSLNNNDHKKYIVAEIKIRGVENCGYDNYILTRMSGLSVGDKVNVPGDEITLALKAFLKQGLFSWGKILATKQTTDSVWIEIVLQPSPIVSNINFAGVEKSEQEELETKMGIVCGSQLTPDLVEFAKKRIKDFFIEKGFSEAEVKIRQKKDVASAEKVTVDVIVNKNRKVKVRRIHIVGNNAFSDYTLKAIMKNTNEGFSLMKRPKLSLRKLFSSKKFIREKYDKDVENIILKYNDAGYRDARIVSNSIVLVHDNQVDIYLTIDEGSKYHFRDINWVGNTLYSSENLSRMLNIKSGDVYDLKKLNARILTDLDAVSNLYYNNGYVFSSVNPVEVGVENDSVDVEIRILEGIQATINRISINGNDRVYEDVIRRELITKPGQLFSKEAMIRSRRAIAQMGYFDSESIDVQLIPDFKTGTVDVNYNLTPKSNDQIEFSAGWGGKDKGIISRLNLKFSNFSVGNFIHPKEYKGIIPQGEGQTLALSIQTNGSRYQLYNVLFSVPWIGGKCPNIFSFSIDDEIVKDSINGKRFGLSAIYNKRLSWLDNCFTFMPNFSYRHETKHDDIYNLFLGLTLDYNSTDSPIYPRYGSAFSLSVNATPPYSKLLITIPDGWKEYYKWKFKGKVVVPLTGREKMRRMPVLMSGFECGFVGDYGCREKLLGTFCMGDYGMDLAILQQKFGDSNEIIGLRGYKCPDSCSDSCRSFYTKATLELRYPFVLDRTFTIYGLTFVEAGNVGEIRSFKKSAGAGIRILFPIIGLIGVDWAYGFDCPFDNSKLISGVQHYFIFGKEF